MSLDCLFQITTVSTINNSVDIFKKVIYRLHKLLVWKTKPQMGNPRLWFSPCHKISNYNHKIPKPIFHFQNCMTNKNVSFEQNYFLRKKINQKIWSSLEKMNLQLSKWMRGYETAIKSFAERSLIICPDYHSRVWLTVNQNSIRTLTTM